MAASHAWQATPARGRARGFTLIEILLAITILLVLMIALFSVSAGVAGLWRTSSGKISAFQNARSAFSTLSETLSRATLNTYTDYVNVTGGVYTFRHVDNPGNLSDPGNASNFKPTQFARASELHFLSGSTVDLAGATETTTSAMALDINATPEMNPGHAVFFQAPLGDTANPEYSGLKRAVNSVGFYVQYGPPDPKVMPSWLADFVGAKNHRYRLVEYVEPSENLQIYGSTKGSAYLLDWMSFAGLPTLKRRTRVLAEDVLLLVLRPRLSPADEASAATAGASSGYDPTTQFGSVLCPNYHYDSRAWQATYPTSERVNAAPNGTTRARYMMNQLPPIIDVAIVCADALSLARFDNSSATPPVALKVPDGLFTDSAKMESDLNTYSAQLAKERIRFHIQRATIGIPGTKWSNN